jgi:cbb3-type cytochrome c oxidase subunit II
MIHPEKFSFVFLIAGLVFFAFAFVVMGLAPVLMFRSVEVKSIDALAEHVTPEFEQLAADYPVEFQRYFGKPDRRAFAQALELGRDVYVAEACWHCHSQFVRPVSRENVRFGKVSTANEYLNRLQLPQLLGTRRVGPDLSREAGKHSNDWHVAHFYEPSSIVPSSVMPAYRWFYDEARRPNRRGLAITAYVQWLGSWARADEGEPYRVAEAGAR